jgi:hypothetical protein
MMTASNHFPSRAIVLGAALAIGFAVGSPALAGTKRWRDDQIPFGSDGTIGRGTDSAYFPPYNIRGGIPLFTFGRSSQPCPPERNGPSIPGAPSRLWRTNQVYEPGDGRCYPIYYNPETGMYFYGPAGR